MIEVFDHRIVNVFPVFHQLVHGPVVIFVWHFVKVPEKQKIHLFLFDFISAETSFCDSWSGCQNRKDNRHQTTDNQHQSRNDQMRITWTIQFRHNRRKRNRDDNRIHRKNDVCTKRGRQDNQKITKKNEWIFNWE